MQATSKKPGGKTDMTYTQFMDALKRHNMKWVGFMGYVEIGFGRSVSILNAPKNNRARLAYLLREQEEAAEENEARLAKYKAQETA